MKKKALFVLAIALLFPLTAFSYDASTHAALTREAYNKSAFLKTEQGKPNLLMRLGVSAYGGNLGNVYLDMTPDGSVYSRHNNPGTGGWTGDEGFTENKFKGANKRLSDEEQKALIMQSPAGWLMVGAIREDDVRYSSGLKENSPQDDPLGNVVRVLNHFYDPLRDSGQRPFGVAEAYTKATDWAIEGTYRGPPPSTGMFGGRDNRFTIKSAREAMFRAATMRRLENGELKPLPTPEPSSFATMTGLQIGELFRVGESEERHRRAYWATVFKSLGHALHLLHDMAQPQHVRNDSHSGTGCIPGITGNISNLCAGGEESFYEKYLEARVAGKAYFVLSKRFFERYEEGDVRSPSILEESLDYGDYDIPRFNSHRDYYSTHTGETSYTAGKGLANYTNKGFFSAGTNLGKDAFVEEDTSSYVLPPRSYWSFNRETIAAQHVRGMDGNFIEGNNATLTLLNHAVTDNLNPGRSMPSVPLTSYSVFDQFMEPRGFGRVFNLNHYNYNAQADLLLPRAVAYSAGLIDYFFRGNMEISLPKEGVYGIVDHAQFANPDEPTHPINDFKGFGKIKLKLKNKTEDVVETASGASHPQTMSDGILVATIKFYRNKEYTDNLDKELPSGASVANYLAQRTPEREMILSELITLDSLAYDEETELTFNFPKELPINAWGPVTLSVVFRGKLGDEEDAVIVSEKMISPPVFFTLLNSLDYIDINRACYTKAQVINSDSLWESLRPDCKKSLNPSDPREFSDMCQREVINASVSFGGTDSDLTFLWSSPEGALQVRRFGRVAFLGDNGVTSVTTSATSYQGSYGSSAFTYKDNAVTYFRHSETRGIKAFAGDHYFMSGAGNSGRACANGYMSGHPTLLQGEERLPVPATSITGW